VEFKEGGYSKESASQALAWWAGKKEPAAETARRLEEASRRMALDRGSDR
jgi:hypothetical protein